MPLALVGTVMGSTAPPRPKDGQYLFVEPLAASYANKVLAHALREAYRDVLHGQQQPQICLFLTL
ncbi:MAG: DNA mismatch repair protein MutL, partial [Betaproteobacteria bacterium]|nr:DNA mismatch repair protein MutL [Betaproteobacteria bacterium]